MAVLCLWMADLCIPVPLSGRTADPSFAEDTAEPRDSLPPAPEKRSAIPATNWHAASRRVQCPAALDGLGSDVRGRMSMATVQHSVSGPETFPLRYPSLNN